MKAEKGKHMSSLQTITYKVKFDSSDGELAQVSVAYCMCYHDINWNQTCQLLRILRDSLDSAQPNWSVRVENAGDLCKISPASYIYICYHQAKNCPISNLTHFPHSVVFETDYTKSTSSCYKYYEVKHKLTLSHKYAWLSYSWVVW